MIIVAPGIIMLFSPIFSMLPISRVTPAKPSTNPTMTLILGLVRLCSEFNKTIHTGTVAIKSEVSPEGTHCSAHATAPFPPSSRKPPITKACFQCMEVGDILLVRVRAYSISPAIIQRVPAMKNGGIVSTTKRIAK